MQKVKMSISSTGLKLLNRGIKPTLTNWDDEYKSNDDILVEVDKSELISNRDDTYEVHNIESIKVIG